MVKVHLHAKLSLKGPFKGQDQLDFLFKLVQDLSVVFPKINHYYKLICSVFLRLVSIASSTVYIFFKISHPRQQIIFLHIQCALGESSSCNFLLFV